MAERLAIAYAWLNDLLQISNEIVHLSNPHDAYKNGTNNLQKFGLIIGT